MNILKKTWSRFSFIIDIFQYNQVKKNYQFPFVYTIDETLDYLLNTQKSVARFGDGEFNLLSCKSIGFQKGNEQLAKKLNEVISNVDNDFCEVMIPRSIFSLDGQNLSAKLGWMQLIGTFYPNYQQRLDKNFKYYNSLFTRFYVDIKDKKDSLGYIKKIKKIWEGADLLIIEGKNSRLGIGNNLFSNSKSIKRIITKDKDAFSVYDEILENAKKFGKNKLILIALGPTATVMSYELAKEGYHVIDIGHIDIEYEWMLKKAKKKVKIEGKHVNELAYFKETHISEDSQYLEQIIKKIL